MKQGTRKSRRKINWIFLVVYYLNIRKKKKIKSMIDTSLK